MIARKIATIIAGLLIIVGGMWRDATYDFRCSWSAMQQLPLAASS